MANPIINQLPEYPKRSDAPANFTSKADAFVAALPQFVDQTNTTITWMGQQVTDVAANAKKAGDSAAAASTAKTYADSAANYRDSAQAAAAAAQSSAGLPAITGKAGYALTVTADEKGVAWLSVGATGFQEFTSSGTFTKPAGARFFYIEVVGAGGAGGGFSSSSASTNATVYGGDGGDYNFKLINAADVPDSVSVSVGVGGNSPSGAINNGGNGSASSFGNLVRAAGGVGGSQYSTGTTSGEMRGGKFGGNSIKGGGAGAPAGLSGGRVSSSFAAGTSLDAGSGGSFGNTGGFPGGGGGAKTDNSGNNITAGNGAGGRVRIWWW